MPAIELAQASDIVDIHDLETSIWGHEVSSRYDIAAAVRYGWVYVARDEHIVGVVFGLITRDDAIFVEDLVVAESVRGQGVGRSLLRALASHGRLEAFVDVGNEPSIRMCRACGLQIVETLDDPYQVQPGWRMYLMRQVKRA